MALQVNDASTNHDAAARLITDQILSIPYTRRKALGLVSQLALIGRVGRDELLDLRTGLGNPLVHLQRLHANDSVS